MSLCEVRPQALQQFGGSISEEKLAIVPDIQGYNFDLRGCKRYSIDSDCLNFEELLNGDQLDSFSFPESKRHCGYSISPSPEQFQLVENSVAVSKEVFALEVKDSYDFGANKDTELFTQCGGNSPASSSPVTDFTTTCSTQIAANCQQNFDLQAFVSADFFPNMQQHQSRSVLSHQVTPAQAENYKLVITEQPEEYYRARYNSEGVRAPLKGMVENYPTVQVYGPDFRYGRVDVKLVHEDGTPHTSCSLDTSEGRKNAVSKKIGPFNHMVAEFEDLRIRRVKKEGRKKSTTVEKTATKDGRSDKVASLLFTAVLDTEQGEIERSIQSKPISLTTAPEPAELDWLEPNRGHFAGQEPVVIKGSKMTSPKVTFRIVLPDGRRQELHGSVDKERSHQNVLLVKTPSLTQMSYQFAHQTIRAEVVVVTGRNQMSSNALQFDFIPNHICRECMQETLRPPAAHMASYSPSSLPSYLAPSASAAGPQSPPSTPVAQPPPSSPHTRLQPTPSQIHLAPQSASSYAGQSVATPQLQVGTDASPSTPRTLMTPVSCTPLATPQEGAGNQGKGDDIMFIMRDLMGQDCNNASQGTTLSVNINMQVKEIDAQYMYSNPQTSYSQLEGQMQQVASPYIPVTSPSAASDQPCYSPVTPVQSPSNSASWSYIEQMLATLFQNEQINRQDYRILTDECSKQNPALMQAFNSSQSNERVFLQLLLAHVKPAQ